MNLLKTMHCLSFLRLAEIFIGLIIVAAIAIPIIVIASTENLQKLLNSELGIEVSEQVLNKLDAEEQTQMEHELGMLRLGRNLFTGPTAGESAIQVFTQLIESETTPNILSSSFDYLLEIIEETAKDTTSKALAGAIREMHNAPKYAMIWGEIQAMKEIPRERLILHYVNERNGGKDDSMVWNNLLDTYDSYERELGLKFSEGSIGTLSGQIGAQINILKDPAKAEAVHAEAEFTYNSYVLANEIDENLEAKEILIQKIHASIEEANQIEENKPSLLSRIWQTITSPFKFLWNKVVFLFTKKSTNTELTAQIAESLSGGDEKKEEESEPAVSPENETADASAPTEIKQKENPQTPATQQPQVQQSAQPPAAGEKEASASILVVDQFNEPVEGAHIWLEDEQGKTYPSGNWYGYWNTDKVGRLFFFYDEKGEVPNGKFNIHIEKENYSTTKENVNMSFSPAAVVISPSKFVLNKLPIVAGILLDASGEPAIGKSYKNAADSPFGYNPKITITSSDGKIVDEINHIWSSSRIEPKTGRFESKPLLPGHYLLKVWIPDDEKPEVVMATRELDISYSQKEIWLGQIIINGIPFNN